MQALLASVLMYIHSLQSPLLCNFPEITPSLLLYYSKAISDSLMGGHLVVKINPLIPYLIHCCFLVQVFCSVPRIRTLQFGTFLTCSPYLFSSSLRCQRRFFFINPQIYYVGGNFLLGYTNIFVKIIHFQTVCNYYLRKFLSFTKEWALLPYSASG